MDDVDKTIRAQILAQRNGGLIGDHWDNFAIARSVLHEELGYIGSQREPYNLSSATRDILIAHGRQDAAHALSNSRAILDRLQKLTRLLRVVLAVGVIIGVLLTIVIAAAMYVLTRF
jgi:hypothetical protein